MANSAFIMTKIGVLKLSEENEQLTEISFSLASITKSSKTPLLSEAESQILAYFEGKLKNFSLPLKFTGTEFMVQVYKELVKIPYGETKSYQEIAVNVNKPKASRAVGNANHKNPLPIIVPCHRVIGKNGKLTGYAGGLEIKETLLRIEGIKF